jgi:hypothetical protein
MVHRLCNAVHNQYRADVSSEPAALFLPCPALSSYHSLPSVGRLDVEGQGRAIDLALGDLALGLPPLSYSPSLSVFRLPARVICHTYGTMHPWWLCVSVL